VDIQKKAISDPENTTRMIEKLFVDGKLDKKSEIQAFDWTIKSPLTFFGLLDYPCDDPLFHSCHSFSYDGHREAWYEYQIGISVVMEKTSARHFIAFSLTIDLFQWDKPYSFNSLMSCYKDTCKKMAGIKYGEDSEYGDGAFIELTCRIKDRKAPLRHTFDHLIHCLQRLNDAEDGLLRETSPNEPESLTATFNFPPEVRSACNQYLMYFGQFLEDLGILADTSLKEHMNKVLFTVTPRDKDQALDVIYEALDVFLHAPDAEIVDEMNEQDFAHYQWKLNMYHLKGQLELAKALLQAKDATIEALKIANYQVQQPQPNSSNSTVPASEKEDEDILGGAVSITKYKAKGFTINLPRIIRKLRRKK
jgi:hypothetical protein